MLIDLLGEGNLGLPRRRRTRLANLLLELVAVGNRLGLALKHFEQNYQISSQVFLFLKVILFYKIVKLFSCKRWNRTVQAHVECPRIKSKRVQ